MLQTRLLLSRLYLSVGAAGITPPWCAVGRNPSATPTWCALGRLAVTLPSGNLSPLRAVGTKIHQRRAISGIPFLGFSTTNAVD